MPSVPIASDFIRENDLAFDHPVPRLDVHRRCSRCCRLIADTAPVLVCLDLDGLHWYRYHLRCEPAIRFAPEFQAAVDRLNKTGR